ncbi:hypothetical protein AB1K62_11435 [Parasphingorhabdus sp. JC815]|uniref:hypothetical protein n=1 Tax=Parasphingorhabdus sp. JC815 TaxID=3232140 RepID=UPI003459EA4F
MTGDMIYRLEQGFAELIDALDGQDPELILQAAAMIRPMVKEIEEAGVWHEETTIRSQLITLSKLIEAARYRVNKLTDINQQRAINLSRALGTGVTQTYSKHR